MTLACPSCATQYNLDETRVPSAGMQLRCPKCGVAFNVTRQGVVPDAPTGNQTVPLPAGRAPAITRPLASAAAPSPVTPRVPLPAPVATPPRTSAGFAAPPAPPTTVPLPGGQQAPLHQAETPPLSAPAGSRVPLPGLAPPRITESAPAHRAATGDELDPSVLFGDPEGAPKNANEVAASASSWPDPATSEPDVEVDVAVEVDNHASRVVEAPQSLDLGADLGVNVPSMGAARPRVPLTASAEPQRPLPQANRPIGPPPVMSRGGGSERSDRPVPGAPTFGAPRPEQSQVINNAGSPTQGAGGGKRFQIRRASGKIFGPFAENRIVKMLVDGELAGDEAVKSEDGDWQPLVAIEAFASATPRAAPQAPAADGTPGAPQAPGASAPRENEGLKKLQQVYGDRMAGMTLVDRVPWQERARKLIPLAIAVAAVLAVLIAGFSLGLTTAGVFGRYLVFGPPHTSSGSAAGALVAKARAGLRSGSYGSLRAGFASASKAHVQDPLAVDAAGLMGQLAGALAREAAGEGTAELAQARQALALAVDYGPKHPDVLRAQVALALAENQPAQAKGPLELLRRKDARNSETQFLEALLLRTTDRAKAKQLLLQVVTADPTLAKGFLALSDLARHADDTADALAQAQTALSLDSKLGRAALVVEQLQFAAGKVVAEEDLRALAADQGGQSSLSMGQRASALALVGESLVRAGKNIEGEHVLVEALKIDAHSRDAALGLAALRLSEHRGAAALATLAGVSMLAAKDSAVAAALAEAQIDQGHYQEAAQTLVPAVAAHPKDPHLATLQGIAAASLGKSEEAEKVLLAAIASDPTQSEAYIGLAKIYLHAGSMAKAKAELDAALLRAPQSSRAHVAMAQLHMAQNDREDGRRELMAAVNLDPQNAEAHLLLGKLLQSLKLYEPALSELRKAEALDANLPHLRVDIGLLLESQDHYGAAADVYRQAIAANEKDPEPLLYLGRVLREVGDNDGSLQALHQSSNLDSQNSEVHAELALTLLKKAENGQALLESKTAVDADEKNPDAWRARGRVQSMLAANKEALDCFDRAAALQPGSAETQQLRGQVLAALDSLKPAIAAYQKALDLDPSRLALLLEIGQLQVRQKEYAAALKTYKRVLEANPPLVEAYYLTGRALDEAGKGRAAVTYYELATKTDPENAMPFKYLGYYYKSMGQSAKATALFEAYLKKRPDAEDKEVILEEIGFLKHG